MLRVPGQVFAGQLALDEFGIFGQEKDSSLQTDMVGALFDIASVSSIHANQPGVI